MSVEARRTSDVAFALWVTLALRIGYSAVAAIMAPFLRLDPMRMQSNQLTAEMSPATSAFGHALLGIWERFDTLWYLHIASSGYDRPDAVVFFPLYPVCIRLLSIVVGSPILAALLVSTVATFFLLLGLVKLARLDGSNEYARRAAFLCGVWPASFVLMAGYPESLVAAFTVWAVYAARTNRWAWAGAAGLCAALAKAVGVVCVVPLGALALRGRKRAAVLAALPLLAPLAIFAVVAASGHGPASSAYATYWRTQVAFPWTTVFASFSTAASGDTLVALNLGALLVVVLLVLLLRTRPEHTLFALGAVAFFLVKKTDPLLQSTLRYILCVFPIYLSLAQAAETRLLTAAIALPFLGLNLILLWHFLNWSLVV